MADRIVKIMASSDLQKGYPAPVIAEPVSLREGYAAPAPAVGPARPVPTTAMPRSAVPPPPK